MLRGFPAWLVSIAIHTLLVAVLCSITMELRTRPALVQVLSSLTPQLQDEDFVDLTETFQKEVKLDDPVSLRPANLQGVGGGIGAGVGAGGEGGGLQMAGAVMNEAAAAAAAYDRLAPRAIRPLSSLGGNLKLDGEVKRLVGATVDASPGGGGGGDEGSVDRITVEILRQLQRSKVLVVWVMDASGSLAPRRNSVINRFDRVYKELEVLDKSKDEALLTGVVAFGKSTVFMTPKPTANQAAIKKAVRDIKTDESGIENVFTAVKETVLKWRSYQTHGRRKLMMIVLTDEIGDDFPKLLDDTVDLVKRTRTAVYVLGPMAPFGRKQVFMRWTDKETGETFDDIPVERGPETVQVEHLSLPYWYYGPQFDLFPSGFGPYALSRLARESGGIYFMFDDGAIPGPRFSVYDLLEYTPDYLPLDEYLKTMNQHPLRAAVVKAAADSRGALGTPTMHFLTENLSDRLSGAQRIAAATLAFVDKALANLQAVEKYRPKETSKRWQAHFDLMMGRLLAAKVRCNEYNWALAQMKSNPKTPTGKDNNAWALAPDDTIAFGKKEIADSGKAKTNVKKSDPKATERARQDAEKALTYLRRVVAEHEGTPWAMMARRELDAPLGFKWVEYHILPTPRQGQRPTEAQRAEMERQQRRAEAAKRKPKL